MSDLTEQYIIMAHRLFDDGRYAESIAQLRAALAITPLSPALHLQLGIVLLTDYRHGQQSRRLEEAIREFTETLRRRPDWPEARAWLETATSERPA